MGREDIRAEHALEVALEVVDLNTSVAAVGDVQLRPGLAFVHEDRMWTVERADLGFLAVDGADVFTRFGEPVHAVLSVTIGHPGVAVADILPTELSVRLMSTQYVELTEEAAAAYHHEGTGRNREGQVRPVRASFKSLLRHHLQLLRAPPALLAPAALSST